MKPEEVLRTAIMPALALLPPRMTSAKAITMLLAIGLQESRFQHRRQINGPARGFWQFEHGGGVKGVMGHASTKTHAMALCAARGVPFVSSVVYTALEYDDVLAAGFARLLLWTDAAPLPDNDDAGASWALYLRTWRPGKPHAHTWPELHQLAAKAAA